MEIVLYRKKVMRKVELSNKFIDAWARKDRNILASCLSKRVKCHLIDKDTHITSKDEFLKYASEIFNLLQEQNAEIIPVFCKKGNYYELIYSFILPVAVANGEMVTSDAEQEAYMEIRKVFIKTYVYFEFNLFKIKKITFSGKEI